MKLYSTTLAILLVCLLSSAQANPPPVPLCTFGKFDMLHPTIKNIFNVAPDSHPENYHFGIAIMGWGNNYEGTLQLAGQTAITHLYCVDADQWFVVRGTKNTDQECIIDSGTETGDNHLQVVSQYNVKCTINPGSVSRIADQAVYHDTITITPLT